MSTKFGAFDGYAFDDDTFDCEFFEAASIQSEAWTLIPAPSPTGHSASPIGLLLALTGGGVTGWIAKTIGVEGWTSIGIPVVSPIGVGSPLGLLLALTGGSAPGWTTTTARVETWTSLDDDGF